MAQADSAKVEVKYAGKFCTCNKEQLRLESKITLCAMIRF